MNKESLLYLEKTVNLGYRNSEDPLWIQAFEVYNESNPQGRKLGMTCRPCYHNVLGFVRKLVEAMPKPTKMTTRTYIPKESGVTKDYAIRLDRTLILPNVKKEFYHENIKKEKQIISGTFDVEDKTIQLDFKPDKLLNFLLSLEDESIIDQIQDMSKDQLSKLLKHEKEWTAMFDSDVRVGLALLDEIRKLNQNKDEYNIRNNN